MDKVLSYVENTGVKGEETFTFRFCAPKSKLIEQYEAEGGSGSVALAPPVTFNKGLLEGVSNSFELIASDFSVSGIALFVEPTVVKKGPFGIHVAGIKLSLLEGGVVTHTADMILGEPHGRQKSRLTGFRHYYTCPSSTPEENSKWTDSVDQLKFDITVRQVSKLEFKLSENSLVNLPMEVKARSMKLSKYYLSSHLSDASIKCEEQTIPVHLMVLSECSPAFAMMFEHETKEKEEKCVEIKDARVEAVKEMLRYFYTDTVHNLEIIGFQLYELADKYLVENLKQLCTSFLISNVTMNNVVELYHFGQKHQNPIFIKVAEDFLSKNAKLFIKNYQDIQTFLKDIPAACLDDVFRLIWRNP